MSIPVLSAAFGASWEARLIAEVAHSGAPLTVTRRCVDVVELIAVAAVGHSVAALIDPRLRNLDADAVERVRVSGVVVVGITGANRDTDVATLQAVGIDHVVPAEASAAVIAEVVLTALADRDGIADSVERGFSDPVHASGRLSLPATGGDATSETISGSAGEPGRGEVVAVWGPTGAPGRTTLALNLADSIARAGAGTLLIDADVYGGVVACALGLLDESPGLAAACRQAQSRRLDVGALASLAWQMSPTFRVLTGLPRPDRWPELRSGAISDTLDVCRRLARFTVIDVGFCLETDEEISFDTAAPRRNAATLAVLAEADVVLAVGSADPVGIQRLARGLAELRELDLPGALQVVLNRVRAGVVPGDPATQLGEALRRFVGQAASAQLPFDPGATDAATAAGQTLAEASPTSALTSAITDLASTVAGVEPRDKRQRRRHAARRVR